MTVDVDDHADENLFYKHFPRGLGKPEAYENGAPDYAGVGPRSGDAADRILDLGSSAVTDTAADDLSIILSVAQLALYPSGVPQKKRVSARLNAALIQVRRSEVSGA